MSDAGLRSALVTRIHEILGERYHHRHPFNIRLHGGECTREEVQRWVRNRYYYQTRIPIKDGVILTKTEDRAFRRGWIRRIRDHDGFDAREGGLAMWLRLAEACGAGSELTASLRLVLPGVRSACDAYVEFVQKQSLFEAVAASLTELRAGPFLAERAAAFRLHYDWIGEDGLEYFLSRTEQAPRDAEEGLAFVLEHTKSAADAQRAAAALLRKCEILEQLLDGVAWGGKRPRLAAGAKLRNDDMVVLPERAVQVGGSGREILEACDGLCAVDEVAMSIRKRRPDAPERLEREVFDFILGMEQARVLELDP